MVGEENRHQMMQNPFGDQSEEEEEQEIESTARQRFCMIYTFYIHPIIFKFIGSISMEEATLLSEIY